MNYLLKQNLFRPALMVNAALYPLLVNALAELFQSDYTYPADLAICNINESIGNGRVGRNGRDRIPPIGDHSGRIFGASEAPQAPLPE